MVPHLARVCRYLFRTFYPREVSIRIPENPVLDEIPYLWYDTHAQVRRLRGSDGGDADMKTSLQARGVTLCLALICLVSLLRPARSQDPLSYFDWRNVDGKDYTTPIRSQSVDGVYYAGTCWAFGAVAALECKLEICYDLPDWNPDLSEQHLVCDPKGGGTASSGKESSALRFIKETGIVTEEELPYTASNDSPNWPLEEGWEDRVYSFTHFEHVTNTTTDNVKYMLRTHGPLTASMFSGTNWNDSDWIPTPESAPTFPPAGEGETGGVNHTVCVVGYMDDETIENDGYWIIKNSWGTGYGDNGYYYIPYGVLESHDAIYAVTGDALAPVPEPTSMILLSAGFVLLRKRRSR